MIIGALVQGERKKEITKKTQRFSPSFPQAENRSRKAIIYHTLKASTQYKVLFYMPVSPNTMKMFDTYCFSLLLSLSISAEVSMCCYPWIVYSITCPIDEFTFCKLSYRAIFSISCFSMRCGRSHVGFSPSSWLQYWKLIKGSTSSIIPTEKLVSTRSTSFLGEESRPCKVPDVLLGGCVTYEAGNDKFLNFFTPQLRSKW